MHRFLIPPDHARGERVTLPEPAARQVHVVLRLRPGERIIALDGAGEEMEVELTEVTREHVTGRILARRAAAGEPCVRVTLCPSLLKHDRFEWVLQKCTELGVTEFVPVISQRTIPRDVQAGAGKRARWQRIIAEAVEQSRRGRLPTLRETVEFEQAVAHVGGCAFILWEEETGLSLRAALQEKAKHASCAEALAFFIGPEGGFAGEEVAYAQRCGVVPVTLGPASSRRILRAETAAIVAAALALYEYGEL